MTSSSERIASKEAVHFPPIVNGVDYLVSVIGLLRREKGDPTPRDLKYAVLHLQAASEVLLKARLKIEHWTLTVKDATKTSILKHIEGDFESPTWAETIRRLEDVVGIRISDSDKRALLNLARTRNALQHWGLTESAPAVETRAADVLDFLIRFLDDQLLIELGQEDLASIDEDMVEVRTGLLEIKAYVVSRMDRLRDELQGVADRTVQCPDCSQFALVVDGLEDKCHFCPRSWAMDDLAQSYASEILGLSRHYVIKEGGSDPIVECPECGIEALVMGVVTAASSEGTVNLCFSCAGTFDDLTECLRCGRMYRPDEDEVICQYCWRDLN